MQKSPLHLYWHIYLTKEGWDIMDDQSNLLVSSGLYDACKSLTIGVIGSASCFEQAKGFLMQQFGLTSTSDILKNKVTFLHSELNVGEYLTLRRLYEDCALHRQICIDHDNYILYFHTKGASFTLNESPKWFGRKALWRKITEFFVIKKWQTCIEIMNNDTSVQICGLFLRNKGLDEYNSNGAYTKQEIRDIHMYKPLYEKKRQLNAIRPFVRLMTNFWWTRGGHIQNIPMTEYDNLLPIHGVANKRKMNAIRYCHEQFILKSPLPINIFSLCDFSQIKAFGHFVKTPKQYPVSYLQKFFNDDFISILPA